MQTNEEIRKEFEELFDKEYPSVRSYTSGHLQNFVSDWWLNKMNLQKQQIEHCSEPECPECNLVAYEKGRSDMKQQMMTKFLEKGEEIKKEPRHDRDITTYTGYGVPEVDYRVGYNQAITDYQNLIK